MPKVLMVASEATPFAKTGGLADVIGALAQALAARGEEVAVLMPRYRGVGIAGTPIVFQDLRVPLGLAEYSANVHCVTEGKVPYFLVDCPSLYDREGLYGDPGAEDYPDNHVRFAVLARVALTMARYVFRPNIIHCHDWQAALVPIFKRTVFGGDPTFMGVPVVLTIHNLGYQGLFPPEALAAANLGRELFNPFGIEFYGKVNFLKAGLVFADLINTVSRKYSQEIQTEEFGHGLEGVLRARAKDVHGILNGIDYDEWHPTRDAFIAATFSRDDPAGKATCKADLQRAFGLPQRPDAPLLAVISRLTPQKGMDLMAKALDALPDLDAQFVLLGTGDADLHQAFQSARARHPRRIGLKLGFDVALSHKIEAGADMFLMPSRYEPCGLNQMYSLAYGTVPVVRATGGLDDTIQPFDPATGEGTGFKFAAATSQALLETLRTAVALYRQPDHWRRLVRNGMACDFSWDRSATEYVALYQQIVARRTGRG